MNLKGIILSELNQAEEDKYHMVSLICGMKNRTKQNKNSQICKNREQRTWLSGAGDWGEWGVVV